MSKLNWYLINVSTESVTPKSKAYENYKICLLDYEEKSETQGNKNKKNNSFLRRRNRDVVQQMEDLSQNGNKKENKS